jgi:NAD(P)-dependent dehydrogenase (short-subunit alcohol dehydrogenase family)
MKPVILITGASQGIGAAIAKTFAKEVPGCRLALVARSQKNLAAVALCCTKLGARAAAIFPCDVSDAAAVETMAAAVTKRFGVLNVLINNAGVFRAAPLFETSVEDFDQIVATNLRSVFLVSRAFVPAMAQHGRGDVFNMSSIAGLNGYPNGAAYCSAKFGVTGLTKVMRMELKDKGVRVTAVHPGATFSPSWKGSGIASDRMMPAKDVARAFLEVYRMSRRTVIEEIVLRPQRGDI